MKYEVVEVVALSESREVGARLRCMFGVQLNGEGSLCFLLVTDRRTSASISRTSVVSSATSVVIMSELLCLQLYAENK